MNTRQLICVIVACLLLSGCAMVRLPDGAQYSTLGIASVEDCTFREDGTVERCTYLETDAFSGWEAIINGTAKAIVRIFTLGLVSI